MEPLYLIHGSTNLDKIIRSGRILTAVDYYFEHGMYGEEVVGYTVGGWDPNVYNDECPGSYPGAYTTVIFKGDVGDMIKYYDGAILVLNLKLLNRGDFHWNPVDQNGLIEFDTLTADEFMQRMRNRTLPPMHKDQPSNEAVFHHSIPTSFVMEIWVNNQQDKDRFMALSNGRWPVRIMHQYPNRKMDKPMHVPHKRANHCFCF
ncbi:MAG: hypothetical protein CMK92_03390, partial [Pseudomonas sp.]|nr:hypothetical protein [Pseudomonas sp.]